MGKYVYPQDVLPEMGYSLPEPEHSCWSCEHSKVTNAGAVIPGLECGLMVKMFSEAGYENGNPQVDGRFGTCKFHTALMASVHADADPADVEQE